MNSEYPILKYKDQIYVPLDFVAAHMGGNAVYDDTANTIHVKAKSGDNLTIEDADPHKKDLRVGNLTLTKEGDHTRVTGEIEIRRPASNDIRANLSFYNNKREMIGTALISGWIGPGVQPFEAVGKGDFTNYTKVKLTIGYFNHLLW